MQGLLSISFGAGVVVIRTPVDRLGHITAPGDVQVPLWLVVTAGMAIVVVMLWLYVQKVHRLNRQLRESNKIKDTLFSIIAHDLKGPAASASQMFRIMETEDFPPDELKQMIAELRRQTEASFDLLNTLFEWGKAQLKGMKVQAQQVPLKQVVKQNVVLLSPQAVLKDILITCHITEADTVFADPNHVNFVIRNLLSNAIKFTPDGGTIEISARHAGHNLVVAVTDTGMGLSEHQQKEFLNGNLKTLQGTRGEKGSGLGLLLSKEFIAANKGRFWLKSKPGEGATFYFSLASA